MSVLKIYFTNMKHIVIYPNCFFSSIPLERLKWESSEKYESVVKEYYGKPPQTLFFNKGL